MQLLSFSTDYFAAGDRAEAARAAYAAFANIGIEPRGEGPFSSQMTAMALPNLAIGQIANSACAVSRTSTHIAGGNDDLTLFIVTEGRVRVQLKGQEERVYGPGEAYVASNDHGRQPDQSRRHRGLPRRRYRHRAKRRAAA